MDGSQSGGPASSPTASAFDAGISTAEHGAALFYVVAHRDTPDAAVRAVGGEVVARLPDPRQALALAPLAVHAQLRNHADLRLAGPVTVDPTRFQRFAQMIGVGAPAREPTPTSSPEIAVH